MIALWVPSLWPFPDIKWWLAIALGLFHKWSLLLILGWEATVARDGLCIVVNQFLCLGGVWHLSLSSWNDTQKSNHLIFWKEVTWIPLNKACAACPWQNVAHSRAGPAVDSLNANQLLLPSVMFLIFFSVFIWVTSVLGYVLCSLTSGYHQCRRIMDIGRSGIGKKVWTWRG